MQKKVKIAGIIAVAVAAVLVMTACGGEKAEEKTSFEFSNATGMKIEYVKAIDAEDPDNEAQLTEAVENGKSAEFDMEAEKAKGSYLLQIKFADSEFVYTSSEVAFDKLTKLEVSEVDGKIVLDAYYGDKKENIFLEQPAPKAELESQPAIEEAAPAPSQEPVQEAAPSEPAQQPSAPAAPPAESKPQQDGCLNDALFN